MFALFFLFWGFFNISHSVAIKDKFTIIVPTFKRDDVMSRFLEFYAINMPSKCPIVDSIHVLWANIDRKPEDSKIIMAAVEKSQIPIHFYTPPDTSLNRRFFVPPNLKTEALLSIDDDLRIDCTTLQKTFMFWKTVYDVKTGLAPIVGYSMRTHSTDASGHLRYDFNVSKSYSMVLTNAAFLTPKIIEAYNDVKDEKIAKIHAHVSAVRNCEDIAMNYIVSAKYPQLKPRCSKGHIRIDQAKDCISSGKSHLSKRNECMNVFRDIFGRNPLNNVYRK